MSHIYVFCTFCILSYLLTRIILWAIEDLLIHLIPTVRGVDTFSGFSIGFDVKPFSIFLVHVPTFIVRNASYYNLTHRLQQYPSNVLYRMERIIYRIFYEFLCNSLIFNLIYRPLRWLNVAQMMLNQHHRFQASRSVSFNHSLVLRVVAHATNLLIEYIHPFIYFTSPITVSSQRKDSNTLSRAIIALVSSDTVLFIVEQLTAESNGNRMAMDNIRCLLEFKLQSKKKVQHKLWSAQYVSMSVDMLFVDICNADTDQLQSLQTLQAMDKQQATKYVNRRMMRELVHLLETKVSFDIFHFDVVLC